MRRISAIARRRFLRPQDAHQRGPNINERIRAREVRLIDENEEMVGVVPTVEAMSRAYEAGLDLVEVASDTTPPVCRILDFGKYKYELAKKEKANKAKSKTVEMKEVRLGRSLKIDPHDIEIRLNQARKFLLEGHKVQIVQNFRGREMMHKERGMQRMREIIDTLSDISKLETPPRMMGRRMNMILSPDKAKIEVYKRQQAKAVPEKSTKSSKNNNEGTPDKSGDTNAPANAEASQEAVESNR